MHYTGAVQVRHDKEARGANAMRPGLGEQLSYVGGEFSSNFAWNMVMGYLLYYYTDVALLPVASLGTLMLATRVMDAVFDPLVGVAVDRTRTRWGHARPYILWTAVPFAVVFALTFAVPQWSSMAKVAYAYVTFTTVGLLYSMLYIPFGAIQPMMVQDSAIKVRLGSWRAMATALASIAVYSMVLPLVSVAGPHNKAGGFTFAAAVIGGISALLYLLVFFNCRERFGTAMSAVRKSVGTDILRLTRNRIWAMSFAYVFITFIRLGVMVSSTAYLANNVLHRPALLGVLLPFMSVSILIGGFLAGFLINRLGQRGANVAVLLLSIVSDLVMPHLENDTVPFVAAFMLSNVGIGVVAATVFVSVSDAVVYNEAKFGDRNEGLMFAGVSFGMKVGVAIGAAAVAYALSWAHYDPRALSESAVRMIRWLFYYVAASLSILQILCVLTLRYDRTADGSVTVPGDDLLPSGM
jgi:sugar (glycoside-pentoside-hexuronide) transporter